MANQARVTSTDAIESFRASMIVFLAKSRRAIDDVSDDVRRTRGWLQHDQRTHWENEVRRRTKALEQAQAELMSARLARNSETAMQDRQLAVNRAQRAITEAEEKIRNVKKWTQAYDSHVDPFVKRLENLCHFLEQDMPKGVAYLSNVQRILEAYAETPASVTGGSSTTTSPSESEPAPEAPAT